MPESMNSNSDNKSVQDKEVSEQQDYVSKKAYQEVSTDMHKYKQAMKELQAKLNEFEAEKEAMKRDELTKQEKWKELSDSYKKQLEKLQSERQDEKQKFVNFHKTNAFLENVPLAKKEFIKFVNLDEIKIDDKGNIDSDNLKKISDSFKQQYPELLKVNNTSRLPSDAPNTDGLKTKNLQEMSRDELLKLFSKVNKK